MVLLNNGLVEIRQIFFVSLFLIVADECGQQFAVGSHVPLLAVVFEFEILLLGLVFRSLDVNTPVTIPGALCDFVVERIKGFPEQSALTG